MLCFYVPATHADAVRQAVFAAGAGRIGNYDQCAWQTEGTGQFRPLPGSEAFLGETGHVERVDECKVEVMCSRERIAAAVQALVKAHPYETPAYAYWEIRS